MLLANPVVVRRLERTGRTGRRAKEGPARSAVRPGRWWVTAGRGAGGVLVRGAGGGRCHGVVPGGSVVGTGQGLKVTGRSAGAAPVGGTWRVFRANSMTCLYTGPQIWPPK